MKRFVVLTPVLICLIFLAGMATYAILDMQNPGGRFPFIQVFNTHSVLQPEKISGPPSIGDLRISKQGINFSDTLYSLERYVYGEIPISENIVSFNPHWETIIETTDFVKIEKSFEDLVAKNVKENEALLNNGKYVFAEGRLWKQR